MCALSLLLIPTAVYAASEASPVAVLVFIAEDGQMVIHADLGGVTAYEEQWSVPAQVQIREIPDSPLPTLVEALMIPHASQDYLLFNGAPTPRPLPTLTPYTQQSSVPYMLTNRMDDTVTVVAPADISGTGHRFVELTCAACVSGWEQSVLAQLPDAAPIVVVAPYVTELDGAWRTKALATTYAGALDPTADARATLFVRQANTAISAIRLTTLQQITDAPPVRYRYIDGRRRLLTVTLCLVGVLFMSVTSFYLSIAVMRRMHAAVGYKPTDGK